MQIFLTMHHFYLPIKIYLKKTVLATPNLFFLQNVTFLENIPTKFFVKILQIANFMNFLGKNVVFSIVFGSVFFSMFK